MTCREVQDAFVDLQDGRLDAASELRVHAHLESCAHCREHAANWKALLPAMRALVPPPPTPMRARRMELEIERRIAEPVSLAARPRRRWPLYGVPLAVAAAAALVLWLLPRKHGPTVVVAVPPPVVAAPPAFAVLTSTDKPAGERLAAGSRVVLASGRNATLELATLASLALVGPAELTLAGDDQHVTVALEEGRLEAKVAHRQPGQTFVVAFPQGRVEVRGTRFVVMAKPVDSWVRVDEGRVAVFDHDGGEWSVGAGETHEFAPPPAPIFPAVPAPRHVCSSPAVSCGPLTQAVRVAIRGGAYERAESLIEPALRPRPNCRPLVCRNELGYLRAEALRESGRLDEAVAAYKMLDHRDAPSTTRQNALYAAAQLERRLGNLAAARADFDRAVAAAPGGALREEAMLGAMEAAERAGDHVGALAAARRYLDTFPKGIGAAQARRIVASERGNAP
jgi:ferric-dicitrate binding protein FerR (iron transport regulator)